MKRKLKNKLVMFESVRTVLNDYQGSWQTIPAMVAAIAKLDSKLDLLRQRLSEQSMATTGVSEIKTERIAKLREQVYLLSKALYLHGKESGNKVLEARYRTTRTELVKMNVVKLQVRCTELSADLTQYGSELTSFGITPEMISALVTVVDQFSDLRNSTRRAILQRKGITASINDLEKELGSVVRDELDNLMLLFKTSDVAFYRSYTAARSIVDYRGPSAPAPERDDGGSSAA